MWFPARKTIFTGTGNRLPWHIAGWTLFLLVRVYLTLVGFNIYNGFPVTTVFLLALGTTCFTAACYYFIVYVVARLRSWPLIAGALLTMFLAFTMLDSAFEWIVLHKCDICLPLLRVEQPSYYSLLQSNLSNVILKRFLSLGTPIGLLLSLAIPLAAKMALTSYRNGLRSLELEKENLQLQHNYLKSQLNPHFLFNSMNNIYGLINSGQNKRSADLVSKLSQLLRYLLYESGTEKVPLAEEAGFIADYTELEKIRLNDTRVSFDCDTGSGEYTIAPLILIPLVENAFKFVADDPAASLTIRLEVAAGRLSFSITNTIDTHKLEKKGGGIGLANLRKRLDLYYPGKYEYKATVNNNTYFADLIIQLV